MSSDKPLSGDSSPTPQVQAQPGRLSRRFLVAALLILAAALVLRSGMLVSFLRYHPAAYAPQNDGQVYWEMAGRIADGQWVDDHPFFSAPLYPYFLGLVRMAGGDLRTVYVIQLMLHLGTGALLVYLALLKLGRGASLATLVLFFLLEEPVFFSQRLLPSTLQLALVAGLLLAAQLTVQRAMLRRGASRGPEPRASARADLRMGKTPATASARQSKTGFLLGWVAPVGLLAGLLTLSYPPLCCCCRCSCRGRGWSWHDADVRLRGARQKFQNQQPRSQVPQRGTPGA